MKHYFYLLLMAGFLTIVACSEEDAPVENRAPCEVENFGTLCIENTNTYPVKIFLNGGSQTTISAGSEKCIARVPAGNVRVQAEQASGYILYPDTWDFNRQVPQCTTVKTVLTQ